MVPRIFSFEHRVTYADCTAGNHVYYGRYFEFLEAARGALFREIGQPFRQWQDQGFQFPVVESQIRYLAPATYDDVLAVHLWLTQLGRVRMNFGYRLTRSNEQEILRATTVHACATLAGTVQRIPEELRFALAAFVQPSPIPGPEGTRLIDAKATR